MAMRESDARVMRLMCGYNQFAPIPADKMVAVIDALEYDQQFTVASLAKRTHVERNVVARIVVLLCDNGYATELAPYGGGVATDERQFMLPTNPDRAPLYAYKGIDANALIDAFSGYTRLAA